MCRSFIALLTFGGAEIRFGQRPACLNCKLLADILTLLTRWTGLHRRNVRKIAISGTSTRTRCQELCSYAMCCQRQLHARAQVVSIHPTLGSRGIGRCNLWGVHPITDSELPMSQSFVPF
jgi:hypothetical protein